jgi:succinate-acetate transporter protein
MFGCATFFYHSLGASWWMFAVLCLWPDISMLGYLANAKLGASLYNLFHWEMFSLVMAAASFWHHHWQALAFALIWLAHIGFDRFFGYGLKYPTFFKDTHLQRVNAPAEI